MIGLPNAPRAPIDRSAIAHANGRGLPLRNQFRQGLRDPRANALRAALALDDETPAVENLPFPRAGKELQLAAADFNGEKVRHR